MAENYSNLFELPVMFSIFCSFIAIYHITDSTFLILAWIFFLSRVIHSIVHITIKKLNPRFSSYGLGVLILLIMVVRMGITLAA
ncbi:MAG: hypothetical protein HOE90_15440 [Bacteriovoracaceae bacterium]|nr:hypothetical protein [Bacteriovoracaceae bacterium]